MQCVYKCALRFSKGIEPRRAHVSFGATPKVENALLLEKVTKNKIVFRCKNWRKIPMWPNTQHFARLSIALIETMRFFSEFRSDNTVSPL